MKTIICNDFSLHMLIKKCSLMFDKISFEKFNEIVENDEYIVRIGDKNIADVLGLKYEKGNISIDDNTKLVVAKLISNECPSKYDESVESSFEFYEIQYL